jgi:hypothetical protein
MEDVESGLQVLWYRLEQIEGRELHYIVRALRELLRTHVESLKSIFKPSARS